MYYDFNEINIDKNLEKANINPKGFLNKI